MPTAADQLERVLDQIAKAAIRSGRRREDITLVAVTKTVSYERIIPFLKAGVQHVGENRVQEALAKYASSPPVVGGGSIDPLPETAGDDGHPFLHLIGPLQSNKARKAVENFDMIQTVDRRDLADDLHRLAGEKGKVQDCLIQIKISDESSKSGLDPAALPEFLAYLRGLSHLRIRGLMGIPPLAATGDAARPYFQRLRGLFESSRLEILSMGMSSDFVAAIEEGSTMVRIGSALFGPRQ